jgi:hypothetical protein
MSDELNLVDGSIDRTHAAESASTRRRFVAHAAATRCSRTAPTC